MADSAHAEIAPFKAYGWPQRYTIVALFVLGTVLCYVDRVNISIAIIPLASAHGYDPAAQGMILSAFFWGYLFLQLPGGWFADRFGARRVLALGVGLWSLATFITPIASAWLMLLLAARVLLGLGESVNFPAIHSITARWTTASERSRVLSLNYSGMYLGTVAALLTTPPIILALGWQAVFYLSGAIGTLWVMVWMAKAADLPEESGKLTPAELALIMADRPQAARAEKIPWGTILREKAVWAIVLAHVCNNWGYYILLLWLPTYLDHAFRVPLSRLGVLALIPWLATFAASNLGGWSADALRRRGVDTGTVRKILQAAAFGGGALPLIILPHASSPTQAITLVTLSTVSSALGLAAFGVNHLDIGPRYAGVLMGLSNTLATVPGIVGVAATGVILQATGSFAAVFYCTAVVYLIGLTGYLCWASGEQKF